MTATAAPPTPTKNQLTQEDVQLIREFLPYDWRLQFAGKTGLTARQVSDVFYLRTTNAEQNKLVWTQIKKTLVKLNQGGELDELLTKVKNRITLTNLGH